MNRDREIAEKCLHGIEEMIRLRASRSPAIIQMQEWAACIRAQQAALTAASAGHQAEVEKARREENEGCQESVKRYLNNIDVWPSEPPQSKAALNALVDIKGRLVLRPLNNGSARLTVQEVGEG